MPSIPGDLVDLLTRNGTFAFLEDLHESGVLWDLRDFRIHSPAKNLRQASQLFSSSLTAQSLPLYILRAVAQFLPALLMPCSRRGKPRHITSNAKRFQKGE